MTAMLNDANFWDKYPIRLASEEKLTFEELRIRKSQEKALEDKRLMELTQARIA
jgi:hypothetical protein